MSKLREISSIQPLQKLAQCLALEGYCIVENALSLNVIARIRQEVECLEQHYTNIAPHNKLVWQHICSL